MSGTHTSSDFARCMPAVAIELLGEPNKELSTRDELRWGTRGSMCVDCKKGTWCDHEAGGTGGGVLDLLKVKKGLEKEGALAWLRERKHLTNDDEGRPRIVATYDYTDATGELIFQVCRFAPKDFRQRRPDGQGGWVWKTAGLGLCLYRLPELLAAVAAGRTIYVAEGEKSVDLLRGLGLPATCSPGGAGKWRAHHSPSLAGADVVLLPDNDDPGRNHVASVAKALSGIAARVRVLTLPGLPPKGDIADWIEGGGVREGLEALLRGAKDISAEQAEAATPDEPAAPNKDANKAAERPLKFIEPHTLQHAVIHAREWIVEDWLPIGCATLNFGDGGTGKTLVDQQLMTSCATGKSFLGLAVTRCRSLGLFCEDDELELHRRQDRINRAYGVEFDDLDDMIWASGVGQDNTLMRFHSDGRPARTFRLAEIQQQAIAHQARLVIIDTAADVFGGNENDRAQVRAFMGAMNALAMAIAGAVLVNAHPSRNGLSATGDLDGGSTAWSNTARSRWSLERPKAEGGIDADNDERVLTRRKANYASLGATIRLRWCNGVLVPLDRPTGLDALAVAADADDIFMRLLAAADAGNMPVSTSSQAHNFAPKVFAARPDRQGMNRKDFEAAMHRLLAAKKITLVNYGRKGDERRRIAIATEA